MLSLNSPPRKSVKMRRKPSLSLDIKQANSSPSHKLDGRYHTTYKDQVAILRGDPKKAKVLSHFMETGRALSQKLADFDSRPMQNLPVPRHCEAEAKGQDSEGVLRLDASGDLGENMMGGPGSEQGQKVQEISGSGESVKSPKRRTILL